MLAELEREHYQVKVGYLGFMKQYFICVQLIKKLFILLTMRAARLGASLLSRAPIGATRAYSEGLLRSPSSYITRGFTSLQSQLSAGISLGQSKLRLACPDTLSAGWPRGFASRRPSLLPNVIPIIRRGAPTEWGTLLMWDQGPRGALIT